MPIYIEFEGDGFSDTPGVITSGVTLLKLSKKLACTSTAAQVPTPVARVYKVGSNRVITPNTPFDEKSEYLLVIPDDVTDVNGNLAGTSQSYATIKTATKTYTTGDLASAQTLIKGQEAIATAVGVDANKIVYSASLFLGNSSK